MKYRLLKEAVVRELMEEDLPFGVDTSEWLQNPTDEEGSAMRTIRTTKRPTEREYVKWYKADNKRKPSSDGPLQGVGAWMDAMRNRDIDKEAPEKYKLAISGLDKQAAIDALFDTPITVNGITYQNRHELLSRIRRISFDVEDEIADANIDEGEKKRLMDEFDKWRDFIFDAARRAPANSKLSIPRPAIGNK